MRRGGRHFAEVVCNRLTGSRPINQETPTTDISRAGMHNGKGKCGCNRGIDCGAAIAHDFGSHFRGD